MLVNTLLLQALTATLVLATTAELPRSNKRARRSLEDVLPDRDLSYLRRDYFGGEVMADATPPSAIFGGAGGGGVAIAAKGFVSSAAGILSSDAGSRPTSHIFADFMAEAVGVFSKRPFSISNPTATRAPVPAFGGPGPLPPAFITSTSASSSVLPTAPGGTILLSITL
ncbi:hypothetical protein RQP46_005604 [Phenoliferia psychrophenolica]